MNTQEQIQEQTVHKDSVQQAALLRGSDLFSYTYYILHAFSYGLGIKPGSTRVYRDYGSASLHSRLSFHRLILT